MKKTLNIRSIICLVLVLILCFAQSGAVFANTDWKAISLSDVQPASASSEEEVQNEGVVRPEDLDEGLSRKSLDEIEGRRVTVRQPIMEVTNREVDRTPNKACRGARDCTFPTLQNICCSVRRGITTKTRNS